MSGGVLVLDSGYRPVNYISLNDAATMLVTEKAIPVPGATLIATFRSERDTISIPKVISLKIYVPIPRKMSSHITNTILFARDGFTCQYCSTHKKDLVHGNPLTRDHVKPVDKFKGKNRRERLKLANTWDNVVTACQKCNCRKANRLPYEAKMYPIKNPKRPTGILIPVLDKLDHEQLQYVKPFIGR